MPLPTDSRPVTPGDAVLERIATLDTSATGLGSIAAIDPEWASRRNLNGPFINMTVLVKDSIDIAGLSTTGGSLALVDSVPATDSTAVENLRAAGIGVVGKTHLQELCGWVTFAAPSGYSAVGGLPRNPHGHRFPTGGSSSGSAVAAAAGLATITIGTDTGGSIITPAVNCSVYGLRPSTGLISTRGAMPITPAQDTVGPMGRRVVDIAAGLGALVGADPLHYLRSLNTGTLEGLKVGLAISGTDRNSGQAWTSASSTLVRAGAELQPLTVELPVDGVGDMLVPAYDFRLSIQEYFDGLPAGAPIRTFDELYEHYRTASPSEQPFGIENIERSARVNLDTDRGLRNRLWTAEHDRARSILDQAHDRFGVSAIVFPGPQAAYLSSKAGYPAIALPAGQCADGRPFGISVVATNSGEEQLLLDIAASWEAHAEPPLPTFP